jgi:hypothetical protein
MNHVLVILALCAGSARAQPGATEPAPPAPPAPSPAPAVEVDAQGAAAVDLDALIARAEAQAPSLATVARGTVRRARRAISVGPTVGVWSAAFVDPGEVDAALTFGVGFETFKVPVVPSMETLRALIVERVKARLKDRVTDAFRGRAPEPLELDRLAAEVSADVRDEILGLKNVRAKTLERPSLTLGFEANRLFGADRWLARTRAGVGVWKLTLAISAAAGRVCRGATCDDGVKLFTGPEVVVHFLTSKSPRASVIDTFVRADFQATGRGSVTYDQLVLGARFLLDAI